MLRKNSHPIALAAVCCLLIAPISLRSQSPATMRVGTYDSRAIAVAYARSDMSRQWYRQIVAERAQAKAAGDEKRVKELETQGAARQERLHQQGFSTGSVIELMQKIRQEDPRPSL